MTFFLWLFWIFVLLFQLQWARAVLLLQCVGVHCSGFFCCRSRALGLAGFCICAPSLWSADSVAVAHRRCWSSACGILLGKVLNPCLLCWQMNSLSLSHQGSPWVLDFIKCFFCVFWDDHVVVFQLGWITLMYEFLFSLKNSCHLWISMFLSTSYLYYAEWNKPEKNKYWIVSLNMWKFLKSQIHRNNTKVVAMG